MRARNIQLSKSLIATKEKKNHEASNTRKLLMYFEGNKNFHAYLT